MTFNLAALMPILKAAGFSLTAEQIASAEELVTKRLPALVVAIDAKVAEIDKKLESISASLNRLENQKIAELNDDSRLMRDRILGNGR